MRPSQERPRAVKSEFGGHGGHQGDEIWRGRESGANLAAAAACSTLILSENHFTSYSSSSCDSSVIVIELLFLLLLLLLHAVLLFRPRRAENFTYYNEISRIN